MATPATPSYIANAIAVVFYSVYAIEDAEIVGVFNQLIHLDSESFLAPL